MIYSFVQSSVHRCFFFAAPYLTIADNIREIGGEECADRLTQAFRQIEELIAREDDAVLVEEFGICRPFNVSAHSMDIGMFSEGLIIQISSFIDRYQLVTHLYIANDWCHLMCLPKQSPRYHKFLQCNDGYTG